jgi:hypothetical protein
VSDFDAFFYSISQVENYPSPMQHVIKQMRQQWADFLIDLYAGVAERKIPSHQLRNDLAPQVIDGVEIYCLSPKEEIKNSFIEAYKDRLRGKRVTIPDPNLLSAVLLLKYGNAVVILGADALKMNWEHAFERVRRKNLPKAVLLKVPHHGAANAIRIPPNKKKADYLDLCGPAVKAVLFAGDAKHPSREVYEHLKQKSEVYCLSNGVRNQPPLHNPLAIGIPGARAANPAAICNPCVSFEIDGAGNLTTCAGHSCAACN